MGDEENEAESANVAVGLGTKTKTRKDSNTEDDQYHVLAGSFLTESEEANLNGGIDAETGTETGTGTGTRVAKEGPRKGTASVGVEAPRPGAVPTAGGNRKKRSVHAPIQTCDCNNPSASMRCAKY